MSQFYTGITKDAQANMNRSIALYEKIVDKEQSWSSVNDLLYTLGETMAALCAIGDYEQAATLIPNILKANSRHEQMVDQAPPGAIDMYKAFVYAQCMEVYHHLGHKEQAGECYQKCLSTDYVKSPDGVVLLTHYRIWTETTGRRCMTSEPPSGYTGRNGTRRVNTMPTNCLPMKWKRSPGWGSTRKPST